MNDSFLNDEQMRRIIGLIEAQGFTEPFVIAELVNNYISLIQEQTNRNPSLPIGDAIDHVKIEMDSSLENWRKEIRMPGYTPLVRVYEHVVKEKYRKFIFTEWLKIFRKPIYLLVSLATTLLCSYCYYLADSQWRLWDVNMMTIIFVALMLGRSVLMSVKFSFKRRLNSVVWYITNSRDYLQIFLVAFLLPIHSTHNNKVLLFFTMVFATAFFYFATRSISIFRVLSKAQKHNAVTYNYFRSGKTSPLSLS